MKQLSRTLAALAVAASVVGIGSLAPSGAQANAPHKSNVTLTFWHYCTDRAALFNQFAAQYKKLTGVTVKMEGYSGDVLGQKFQAAPQAHTLPDLSAAGAGGGDVTAPYAKERIIRN